MGAAFRPTDLQRAALEAGEYRIDRYWERRPKPGIHRLLTPRWYPLIPHPAQVALYASPSRYRIAAAGRRSGKTEIAKRIVVREALRTWHIPDPRILVCAPLLKQARELYWEDLKALTPRWALDSSRRDHGISESTLSLYYKHGPRVTVFGLDRPAGVEGIPADFVLLDEYARMKPRAWTGSIRPMLSTAGREGRALFIGRPEGRNHFFTLVEDFATNPDLEDWSYFHWRSADLLSAAEIADARSSMDDRSFRQEYEAEFVTYEGRAYINYDSALHDADLAYDPTLPLELCFDFGTTPGVAVYAQEQPYRGSRPNVAKTVTAVLGEVYIPRDSRTALVCQQIIGDWGPGGRIAHHKGLVRAYGDPSGGSGRSSSSRTDWETIRSHLEPVFGGADRRNYYECVERSDPGYQARINAINWRLRKADGSIHMLVDARKGKAPRTAHDLAEVRLKEGCQFEIDKERDGVNAGLTHLCFAAGTLVATEHGPTAIEELPDRGVVLGPTGRPVEFSASGWRGESACVELLLSDDSTVITTPDHPFLTPRGWIEAKDLQGELLCSSQCRHATSWVAPTTGMVATTLAGTSGFTGSFGSTFVEALRMAGMFTTRTETAPTTPSTTSRSCCGASTRRNTCAARSEGDCPENASGCTPGQRPPHGIETRRMPRAGVNSSIPSLCTSAETRRDAIGVGSRSAPHECPGCDSVHRTAALDSGTTLALMTRRALARSARATSWRTATRARATAHAPAALVLAIRPAGRRDVFCPTVPSVGCFALANGAIVSNSDALAYYLHERHPPSYGATTRVFPT